MREILTDAHMECWSHFILACRIVLQFELTETDVSLADALLLQFCKRVERLYGKTYITPNMHLHCHLKECILDFGPIHGFWCFSFERYNGILGELPNNNKSIGIQVMSLVQHIVKYTSIMNVLKYVEVQRRVRNAAKHAVLTCLK